jgi:hypothetical protein
MIQTTTFPAITNIEFIDNSTLFIHLENDSVFIIPLEKFSAIKNLSSDERKKFEIIDDTNLSFLAIDEIYSVEELIGIKY